MKEEIIIAGFGGQGVLSMGKILAYCAIMQDMGYRYFDWNVSSGDAGETSDTGEIIDNITLGCQNQRISVVLQHDIHEFSVEAVEKISRMGVVTVLAHPMRMGLAETELHAMSTVRAVAEHELNIQTGGSGGGADLKSVLAFIGVVCLVILVPLVGYLAVNYIRRASARNKRRRRRQSRRRSR